MAYLVCRNSDERTYYIATGKGSFPHTIPTTNIRRINRQTENKMSKKEEIRSYCVALHRVGKCRYFLINSIEVSRFLFLKVDQEEGVNSIHMSLFYELSPYCYFATLIGRLLKTIFVAF